MQVKGAGRMQYASKRGRKDSVLNKVGQEGFSTEESGTGRIQYASIQYFSLQYCNNSHCSMWKVVEK